MLFFFLFHKGRKNKRRRPVFVLVSNVFLWGQRVMTFFYVCHLSIQNEMFLSTITMCTLYKPQHLLWFLFVVEHQTHDRYSQRKIEHRVLNIVVESCRCVCVFSNQGNKRLGPWSKKRMKRRNSTSFFGLRGFTPFNCPTTTSTFKRNDDTVVGRLVGFPIDKTYTFHHHGVNEIWGSLRVVCLVSTTML